MAIVAHRRDIELSLDQSTFFLDMPAHFSTISTMPTAASIPPRRRWLKRLVILIAATAILLAGARLWWGWYADRQLAALYADYHARGIPILPEDFQPPALPDEENAAFYLKRAAGAKSQNILVPTESTMTFAENFLPYPPIWLQKADQVIAANAAIYPDVRKARGLEQADWGLKYKSPALSLLQPWLNSVRSVVNILADTALASHFHGDDANALEYAADIRAAAHAVDQSPWIFCHLAAISMDALSLQRLEIMAGNLTVVGTRGATPKSASRQQIQKLIAVLLDNRSNVSARLRAFRGDRMMVVDTILWSAHPSLILRPMYTLDAIREARDEDLLFKAATQTDWPRTESAWPPQQPYQTFNPSSAYRVLTMHPPVVDEVRSICSSMMAPSLKKVVLTDFRVLLERRMAAISLATRLYQLDEGHYPATLNDLVPKYLPAVPLDPFSPDHSPIRYLLAYGGTRPVAYSVDEDGLEDTKGEQSLPPFTCWGWQTIIHPGLASSQQRPMDQYRDLSQWMPANPPAPTVLPDEWKSPQAGDEQSEEGDD